MFELKPGYLQLLESGERDERVRRALDCLAACALCGRQCKADRTGDEPAGAFCRTGRQALVANHFAHHGEEKCLRGSRGSGTIFFAQCNLRCVFCQNHDISWHPAGSPVDARQLADIMLALQRQGCHNINLVTPSHVIPHILEAVALAAAEGLRVPLVYNSGGYDAPQGLELLDGVIDIYMPDVKFASPEVARTLTAAEDYWEVCKTALRIMHQQVGDLVLDTEGIARRGLLVRHLVLPNGQSGTAEVMRFLAEEISKHTFVNIMPQYRPEGRASQYETIARRVRLDEYRQATQTAREFGLERLCID